MAATHKSAEYGYNSITKEWYSNKVGNGCNLPSIPNTNANGGAVLNYFKIANTLGSQEKTYNEGAVYVSIDVGAYSTTNVVWEIDWSRINIQREMSLSVWTEQPTIKINNKSDGFYSLNDCMFVGSCQVVYSPAPPQSDATFGVGSASGSIMLSTMSAASMILVAALII